MEYGRETIKSFKIASPTAIVKNGEINKLKQFCSGRIPVLVHPSLYRALKLRSWDISGLFHDDTTKNEM